MSDIPDFKATRKYLVTNFAYGTGPYLRTTNLAIDFNDELEKAGKERLGIIVPWIYGEKQKRVMLEEFAGHENLFPGEILLDEKLGAVLKSIFYHHKNYEEALTAWVASAKDISKIARTHLQGHIEVETLHGKKSSLDGRDIVVELNRSPRIRYDIAPAYFTSFAYLEEILEAALLEDESRISASRDLIRKGIEIAKWVEKDQKIHALAYPGTFSYKKNKPSRYENEVEVPPIAPPPKDNFESIDPGIFITITGIPGLERLYTEAKQLGLKLYSNDPGAVPESVQALPHIISNKNISFQFARSGWSSVWISLISETSLVVPEFDRHDDPEIFFNNMCVQAMELGVIYSGQPLEEIVKKTPGIIASYQKLKKEILVKWGTLDGNRYCAELFVKDFLR
jgi:hypothetical protein